MSMSIPIKDKLARLRQEEPMITSSRQWSEKKNNLNVRDSNNPSMVIINKLEPKKIEKKLPEVRVAETQTNAAMLVMSDVYASVDLK